MKPTLFIPLALTFILGTVLLSVNLRGVHDQYHRPWTNATKSSFHSYRSYRWIRGWPVTCKVQFSAIPSKTFRNQVCSVRLTTPLGFSGHWFVDNTVATFVHGAALVVNSLCGVVISTCAFVALRAICEERQWTIRFSIRSVLLITATVAIGFAIRGDVALATEAFRFWDDLYEIQRSIALLALNLGFLVSILWTAQN